MIKKINPGFVISVKTNENQNITGTYINTFVHKHNMESTSFLNR